MHSLDLTLYHGFNLHKGGVFKSWPCMYPTSLCLQGVHERRRPRLSPALLTTNAASAYFKTFITSKHQQIF